ncbi:unnamed protein product [Rotaria sordida]|uniref:Uncharacterized protein n=1 Tax=Rotaria sordida TaxID=392033 RepID=A0A815XD09_9BILA|nr:unnamed protein product [Rotaria sordida]
MFEQAPRSDSDFWKIVRANGIENEEDSPTPVAESNDDLNINQGGNRINLDEGTDGETITLVNKLSNDAPSSSINSQLNSFTVAHSASSTTDTWHVSERTYFALTIPTIQPEPTELPFSRLKLSKQVCPNCRERCSFEAEFHAESKSGVRMTRAYF